MGRNTHFLSLFNTIQHALTHAVVTILAVGVAFSLPKGAEFILYTWWPIVHGNARLLTMSEISFAGVLVVFINLILLAKEGRRSLRMNRIASLVDVLESKSNWLSRWRYRSLQHKVRGTRDVSVMSVTGYDTFVSEKRNLHRSVEDCYELRVMLMNPYGEGAKQRVQSLGKLASIDDYIKETEATIDRLSKIAESGKKVTLKLYDEPPFWSLIIMGDYVWVQHCQDGRELKSQPEFVFSLRKDKPSQGLFSPFYVYFLNQWNDPRHLEYDFSTKALIGRNDNEVVGRTFNQDEESVPYINGLELA